MGSGAVIYAPNFIKIGSGLRRLVVGIHRHTHRQQGDLILIFFQNKESRLKSYSKKYNVALTPSPAQKERFRRV
jgi:hypothetical protein